jgi:hypothetical protein
LTDVDENTPAFAVVPGSHVIPAIDPPERGVPAEVVKALGSEFHELPLYGRAGTAIFYDISLYHTRHDGPGRRRTQHSYFSRAGTPYLTDWALVPQRLATHDDPRTRDFFGEIRNPAMNRFAAAGYTTSILSIYP